MEVILAKVERDHNGRVLSAGGIMSVYILKDRTNVTSSRGQRVGIPLVFEWCILPVYMANFASASDGSDSGTLGEGIRRLGVS